MTGSVLPVDPVVEKDATPMLGGGNRLKLAVFGVNENRGLVMTKVAGPPQATWPESMRIAQEAERLGFEAIIPLARWLGYGGANNPGSRCFETFTWAAGLAAITKRLQVFATFHVPTVHPVMAAKMVSTIDHISGGRVGLNIVAGWQPDEVAMFGSPQREHDERYEVSSEWAQIVARLWTEDRPFDFVGQYFQCPGAFTEPKPLQKPYPVVMSAGISPAGRAFAARHADLVFVAVADPSKTAETVAELKGLAREEYGRELRIFGRGHVTCRDTEEEARASYDYYIREHGDTEAGENVLAMLMANSQTIDYASAEMQALREAVIRGYFAHEMTGTPEQITETMAGLSAAGIDGLALTWNDYDDGLERYERQLLPLLIAAGLREPLSSEEPTPPR
jgi:FMNH2-dependent dimethyl sulfone monooxygenase